MKDLGINIVFEPKGSAAVLQKAASRPGSFDLYENIVIKIMALSK
jgi:putative spermidine/putrescine transport system substrate-binding protein